MSTTRIMNKSSTKKAIRLILFPTKNKLEKDFDSLIFFFFDK